QGAVDELGDESGYRQDQELTHDAGPPSSVRRRPPAGKAGRAAAQATVHDMRGISSWFLGWGVRARGGGPRRGMAGLPGRAHRLGAYGWAVSALLSAAPSARM